MDERLKIKIKKIWFGLFNRLFFQDKVEFSLLFWLNEQNKSKGKQWFLISFILVLSPFLISLIIEFIINQEKVINILNNGSIPVLAFSIIATNLIYLLDNIPTDREVYVQLKIKILVISIFIILASSILYIFQSNFVSCFSNEQLIISYLIGVFLLIISVIIGKKMFLLQNKFITFLEENFRQQLDELTKVPKDNDIAF